METETTAELKARVCELKAQLDAIEVDIQQHPTVLDESEFEDDLGPLARAGMTYKQYVTYCRQRAARRWRLVREYQIAQSQLLTARGA